MPHGACRGSTCRWSLGFSLGRSGTVSASSVRKLCLILDREPYRYQKYCSDIAGQDIRSHGGEPQQAVRIVRDWLRNATAGSNVVIPSGSVMVERYEAFQRALPLMCERLQLKRDELIFNDYTTLAAEWLKVNSW